MRNELLPPQSRLPTSLEPLPALAPEAQRFARRIAARVRPGCASNSARTRRSLQGVGSHSAVESAKEARSCSPLVFSRQTTTRIKPSTSASGEIELPKPALGIQGSITASDIVSFLRENGAFDLETDYSDEGTPVQLNRLTLAQITRRANSHSLPPQNSAIATRSTSSDASRRPADTRS